jgi:serine/threonine-protein kinase MRCK
VTEKRDRINVQNMQIALEKEFQAKEKMMEENQSLRVEIDAKQHKITDMQAQIDELKRELNKRQDEINEFKSHVLYKMDSEEHVVDRNNKLDLSPVPQYQSNHHHHQSYEVSSTNEDSPLNPITEEKLPVQPQKTVEKRAEKPPQSQSVASNHKFEVVTFQSVEKCEYCGGILYGIARQAIKCKEKSCSYLCHPKCRDYLPANCPININQRFQLKSVDFVRGVGTLIQGHLKMPKVGGVKKGWQDNYVFLSNSRLFIYPINDGAGAKPSLIPSQIIDIRNPDFSVSSVTEADVIHANKRDIPCILKMIVTKLKQPTLKQKLLFCAKDENEKINWINVLKDLNERLAKNTDSFLLPIEAREVIDNTPIKNVNAACLYDYDRMLVASDEGVDVVDTRYDSSYNRIYDKKTFKIDVMKDQKLIVTISGKNHQIMLFPTIIIEGINAETIKIDETKGCSSFCSGRLIINDKRTLHVLCVAIKKTIFVYEINTALKPKYKKLREIELTMNCQSLQIIDDYLCVGLQSEFALYSLNHESTPIALVQEDRDKSLDFLNKNPTNALLAVKITHEEYLLVFETLGLYVNINGRRSRNEEIMWPSKPLYVAQHGDFLLCYCDRGIDVFSVQTGEWLQIIQLAKTKPLDASGLLSLSNEVQDSIRLIYLKVI